MTNASWIAACTLLTELLSGCAGSHSEAQAHAALTQLQSAMHAAVGDRTERDEQSRLLADSVERADLERMDRDSVRTAFGPGKPCAIKVCEVNGFAPSDWYYEIGVSNNERIAQLPLLILAFDPHEHVKRVFAFTTH
jgi:hypothetical protein